MRICDQVEVEDENFYKMKFIVFLCLFLFIISVAFGAEEVCKKDGQWKEDCNTCWCTKDGTAKACTKMACLPKEEEMTRSVRPKVCEPNTNWKDKYNTCWCTEDGTAAACTLMGCPEDNPPIPVEGRKSSIV